MALIAILGAIAFSAVPVSAQDPVYSNLVTTIAQRFNLKESDVASVVSEVRSQHLASLRTKWEQRLTQAVTDGKITDVQRKAIIAKYDEVQAKMSGLTNLSDTDRKAKMNEIHDDLLKWAADNNINIKQFGALGFGHGLKLGHMKGMTAN